MDNLVVISLVLGDRTYRIKVKKEDEDVVRKTAKTINDKIIEYKTHFAGKDMQDYIAMVMIWFATEKSETLHTEMQEDALLEKLNSIEKLIDTGLNH